jgi:hypothetical protein
MNSLTGLREVVDVLIGVDSHSAAVVDAATGGVHGEITVAGMAVGYAELVEFTNNHSMLRAWAIEGTCGHGRRSESSPAGVIGDRQRVGSSEAGYASQWREDRSARCDPRCT